MATVSIRVEAGHDASSVRAPLDPGRLVGLDRRNRGLDGSSRIEEGKLLCPLHRWRFRLRDGRCTTARGNDVHRYAMRADDGAVWAFF